MRILLEQVGDCSVDGRHEAKFNMLSRRDKDTDIYKGLTFLGTECQIFSEIQDGDSGHETFGEDPYLTSKTWCQRL